jgi:pyruvate dehydrogenase E2 component (dihydrolipoamide acetyltransferase)
MPINILMPALSPTMEAGTLAKWHVKAGDQVKSGQILAEIETDKATMEFEAVDEGTIARLTVAQGSEDVKVGTLIAVLLEEGEDAESLAPAPASPQPQAPNTTLPNTPPNALPTPQPSTQPNTAQANTAQANTAQAGIQRSIASPLARRLAQQAGLALEALQGSGPAGRIIKRDIEAALAGKAAGVARPQASQPSQTPQTPQTPQTLAPGVPAPTPAQAGQAAPGASAPYSEVKLSTMRKVIAKRLSESKQSVPHFYLSVDCKIDALLAVRKSLNARLEADKSKTKISVNDMIIRALGQALKKVPAANVQFAGDKMYHYSRADISVAVAIPGGLVTPVIAGACSKGLADIAAEMAGLAAKAREGKLQPEEYQGGTWSLSNLGMFGIKQFDAVINPPQAGILAVGSGEQRAVVEGGALVVATVMTITGSFDHRAIDGAVGAEFMSVLKGFLEDPVTLML